MLELSEACAPVWDPAFSNWLHPYGSKPLVGPVSLGPTSSPIPVESRARGPEHPNAKSPERACTNLQSPVPTVPCTKRVTFFINSKVCSLVFPVTVQPQASFTSLGAPAWVLAASFSSRAAFTSAISSPVCLHAWPGRCPATPPARPLYSTGRSPGRPPDRPPNLVAYLVLLGPLKF